jgi:hypothetical protein
MEIPTAAKQKRIINKSFEDNSTMKVNAVQRVKQDLTQEKTKIRI